MNSFALKKIQDLSIDIDAVTGLIADTQKENGEIPWSIGDKTDPWDHIEAAIGLCIGGEYEKARLAYRWMAETQLADGSWFSAYRNGQPDDKTRDTNMSSYIAVGLLHFYLITGDDLFLRELWDTMAGGIEFALSLQTPNGEIYWAVSPEGRVDKMALLTGSSSVYMSLKCALAIAQILGHVKPRWKTSLARLANAIQHKAHLFNMTKSRFSMDWFYPILTGAITGVEAQKRIDQYWKKFIITGQGVRCVSDEPWVTLAETSELSLALSAMGNRELSQIVFNWIIDRKFEDNTYWCGYTHPDMVIWPEEKITWTNAVVLMAADAIYDLTPAGQIFSHYFWDEGMG